MNYNELTRKAFVRAILDPKQKEDYLIGEAEINEYLKSKIGDDPTKARQEQQEFSKITRNFASITLKYIRDGDNGSIMINFWIKPSAFTFISSGEVNLEELAITLANEFHLRMNLHTKTGDAVNEPLITPIDSDEFRKLVTEIYALLNTQEKIEEIKRVTTYRDRKLLIYLNTKCDEIIEQLEKKAKFERQKAHAATLQGAKLIEYIKERIFDIDKGEPPKDIQSIFLFQSSNPEYNYWTKWSKETLQVVQPQLKTNLTDPQRELLFDELIKGGFIANDTDRDSFLWAFGGSVPPVNYKPIKWVKYSVNVKTQLNKKALLNLLSLLAVKDGQIMDRKLLKSLFADPSGEPLKYTSANYNRGVVIGECNTQLTDITNRVKQ